MKTYLICLWIQHRAYAFGVLAALVAVSMIPSASAQINNAAPAAAVAAPGPSNSASAKAATYRIAVVDINYIFKNYYRFKAAVDAMKKESEGIEATVKADRERIAAMEQDRNTYGPATPDYKQRDEEVARQMAELNLKLGKLRKDFMERQSKAYYQTYLEVVDAVKWHAKQQNIGLVLRFDGEAGDPTQREGVMREINKQVIVQDQIDITPDVLALLNRDAPKTPAAPVSTARPPAAAGSQIPR